MNMYASVTKWERTQWVREIESNNIKRVMLCRKWN